MTVHVRFFSILHDIFRRAELEIHLKESLPARDVFLNLFGDRSLGDRLLPSIRFAINSEYVPSETPVQDGDELACIPPVSGG